MPAVLAHDIYTNQTGSGPYTIFPTHAHQILSNCIHIFGVSILAYCFARRTENDRFTSCLWWSNLSWARLLIILVFLDSWIFLAVSGILVNGVGLSFSVPVCSLGIFLCIFFYAGSKALIYLFLVERVWVVASAGKSVTRMESNIYKGCAIIAFGYTGIVIVMILGRYASIRDDGACVIGLHSFATIPLLGYDLFINVFLTSVFLWFLYREQSISDRLRRLARRTALSAGIALTTSCVNILILSLLKGKQLGWVCLGSCAADVMVNALVLFWATGGAARDPHWHGAWEPKDGAFADPQELPPLNFPVSFVGDPELGLSLARTAEAGVQPQLQTRSLNRCLVNLGEALHHKDKASGEVASTDVRSRRKDGGDESDDVNVDDDEGSVLEWDITESASSGATHFDTDKMDTPSVDRSADSHPWRLTLDLEPPSTLLPEHSEPDSPATHETAGSSVRLTSYSPVSPHQSHAQKHLKQRRRQWHTRPRRARGRSRPRVPSSPPASSLRSSLRPVPVPIPIPLLPPPLAALPEPGTQPPPTRTPGSRRLMPRTCSDTFVGTESSRVQPGRPRASQ